MAYPQQIYSPRPMPPTLVNARTFQELRDGVKQYLGQINTDNFNAINQVIKNANQNTQGTGPDVASADTIYITQPMQTITGTALINTIIPPKGFNAMLMLFADNETGFSLGDAGNIWIDGQTLVNSYTIMCYSPIVPPSWGPPPTGPGGWWVTSSYYGGNNITVGGGRNKISGTGPFSVPSVTAHGIVVGEGASPVVAVGPLTNGQLLIGSTGNDPKAAALTAGSGISTTPGAGSLAVNNTGILTATGTANEVLVTAGQNPVFSLPATITGPTRITGLAAPTTAGDALSLSNPVATSYAFASLPTGVLGDVAIVIDSNTNVWGAVIAAGGTDTVLAWFNGAAWTVIGK